METRYSAWHEGDTLRGEDHPYCNYSVPQASGMKQVYNFGRLMMLISPWQSGASIGA